MTILFFGDIVGKPGRQAVAKIMPELQERHKPDLVVANIENLAHGKGATLSTLKNLLDAGVDFFTSGNHVYDKPEYQQLFQQHGDKIIRPANFAPEFPGDGFKIISVKGKPVLLVNLLGQVFMDKQVDQGEVTSPFDKINEILAAASEQAKIKILDFHAEATSEKRAMGFWVDGRMSAVVGTHTHVSTADAQILPAGTGYITDIGMTGAAHSVIGVDRDRAIQRLITDPDRTKKVSIEPPENATEFDISYVILEIDEATGKCQNIESVWKIV